MDVLESVVVVVVCNSCGLLYCGRKLLNLLPAIGEGEEEGSAEYEVSECHNGGPSLCYGDGCFRRSCGLGHGRWSNWSSP